MATKSVIYFDHEYMIMPLLTNIQRDRLIRREEKKSTELDAYKKRHNDQVVLEKFGDFINSIPDALLILKHMPPEKLAKTLRPEHIQTSLDLAEALLERIDPWPIAEHERSGLWAFKTVGERVYDSPEECRIETYAWTATNEEIAINQRLKEHISSIQHYVDPYLIDPVCRDSEHPVLSAHEALKAVKEGERTSSMLTGYFRSWRGDDGKVYRKPLRMKVEELKFKRWNPRGLPKKYDVPEQKESDLYGTTSAIIDKDTPDFTKPF